MNAPLPFLTAAPRERFAEVRFKAEPDDFIVEELSLYVPGGTGDHTYFWIEKRRLPTHDAAARLARALGRRAADAGVAGLKDAQAVTRQWISFEHVTDEAAQRLVAGGAEAETLGPGLRVLSFRRHGNKLRMGHLKGNRFVVRLRTADPAALAVTAWEVLAVLARRGVPNYYGFQRFGRFGDNAALGKLLVLGDEAGFAEALQHAPSASRAAPEAASADTAASRPPVPDPRSPIPEPRPPLPASRSPVPAPRSPIPGPPSPPPDPRSPVPASFPPDRRLRNLLVNAFQAELFNQVLARRMPHVDALWAGDLAWLHRNGAVFKVVDPAQEQPRAEAFEISPSGPLFGPKMPFAEGEQGRLEREVLAASGVQAESFGRREAERQPGARRALRVPLLEAPNVEEEADAMRIHLALPSGAYATVVLRELLGDRVGEA